MKTVLITGVSRGIGRALADKFLAEEFKVIGTTTNGNEPYKHPNLAILELNLAEPDSIVRCTALISQSNEKIDILINNAGVLFDENETALVANKLRQTLEVNLIGTADFTERIIPLMNNNGHIVNISSAAGSLTDSEHPENSHFPYYYPAYKISKCALNMYTITLANRLKHEDKEIIVSSVHPGWIRTDMGGEEAPTLPSEAAENIYKLAVSNPETGKFWYNGEKYPW
ncbi:SDR family NAD(P)-dependent oxidoreductase [Patescibacteria group bacterium]|nr:SDR family NAD(P)-dependent oxidoreductase [Patescibacteria group bacterium]MDE1946282.1 SDR family NAD(P)-dependent oxidoreductase [Patescibacteria group bacterium]MDE2010734.1 SDR family NAD(P)-dependent oxidoreductase [Patescibacteria group bacterium]MDE2232618.1 SDR family NAD(P)-dependent oxidoreductase [Patescibacteria group bacterium]